MACPETGDYSRGHPRRRFRRYCQGCGQIIARAQRRFRCDHCKKLLCFWCNFYVHQKGRKR